MYTFVYNENVHAAWANIDHIWIIIVIMMTIFLLLSMISRIESHNWSDGHWHILLLQRQSSIWISLEFMKKYWSLLIWRFATVSHVIYVKEYKYRRLRLHNIENLSGLFHTLYVYLWMISEFVLSINDINSRDTHVNNELQYKLFFEMWFVAALWPSMSDVVYN